HWKRPAVVFPTLAALVLLIPLVTGAAAYRTCGFGGCPDVSRLDALRPEGVPVLLDRSGEPFAELTVAERALVALDDLPPYVAQAFLAVEDKRFFEHRGVDWRRVGGALLANLRAGGFMQGSSTITMQLARNVFEEEIPGRHRTLGRKALEVRVAREIEGRYSKEEILELYLNHIFFGGGARGIEAASRQYFRRPATELSLPQAALLAALPKAPTHYDPRRHPERARERRDLVLALMAEQGRVGEEEAQAARAEEIRVAHQGRPPEVAPPPAPYFVEQVRRELEAHFGSSLYRRPFRVVTTLDLAAQSALEEALEEQLRAVERGAWGRFGGPAYAEDVEIGPDGTPYLQGAAVALDVHSGDVLAWVGGRDFDHSRFDRVSQARRQVGSAFKPFVFTAALAEGHSPSELVSDRPVALDLGHGRIWRPRNFEGNHGGDVSLRQALVSSRNAATVRLAHQVGFERVADYAERLGFGRDLPRRPSLALGAAVASPLELTTAYTTFASLGYRVEPRLVLRVESPEGEVLWRTEVESRRAMDPGLAYVVTHMLRDVVDRGTGYRVRRAGFRGPAAGKTGTTNEGHDAWFVGYTPDLVAGVWIVFDRPRPILSRTSGGLLAAPVWGRAAARIYRERPRPEEWPRPAGVTEARVDPETGLILSPGCEPRRGAAPTEVFLAGLTPAATCPRWREVEDRYYARLEERRGWWSWGLPGDGAVEESIEIDEDERGTIVIRPSRPQDAPEPSEEVTLGFEERDFDLTPDSATPSQPILPIPEGPPSDEPPEEEDPPPPEPIAGEEAEEEPEESRGTES
ncbi:MAG TPA: PBP1A family penicillin-binding protein, partial [Thermoanaerobaculia bacterium]|nr:PBP1A family penicillin-binding protein [Thermoanaerobaculia bacterium]